MYERQFADPVFAAWMQLGRTYRICNRVLEKELLKVNLTPPYLSVLWICDDYHGPLTAAELSRLSFRETHTLAGVLARMERDGLITRTPKRKGQPLRAIQLTAKGEALLRPGKQVLLSVVAHGWSSLSEEEVEQFRKLLQEVQQKGIERLGITATPQPAALKRRPTK